MLDSNNSINFKPDLILDIIIKRRWFIMVPICLSLLWGIFLSITLPSVYKAETLILVEPQRVPSDYVRSIVSTDISARISTISQQILSRTNLEKVINDFQLFSTEEWQNTYLEDKLKNLRKRIDVNLTRRSGADAFRITYQGGSPETVMKVANALASYFINENLKVREAQAVGTSTFLEIELQSIQRRLEEKEETLKEYKKQYMGGLPEQLETNLSILESLQTQKTELQKNIQGSQQNIYALKNTPNQFDLSMNFDFEGEVGGEGSYELTQLKENLEQLELRYKDKHPDVVKLKKRISELEEKAENESANLEEAEENSEEIVIPQIDFQAVQLEELKSSLVQRNREMDEINVQIDKYEIRVEDTPRREQELLSIRRDYDNLKQSYQSLLKRKLESEIAVNMERRQKGEQFRVVDRAMLPEKPTSPNLKKLFLLSLAAGLGIGSGLIFMLEYLDTSFKRPEEIEKELKLAVLCTLPQIIDAGRKRLMQIEKTAFFAFCALSMIVATVFVLLTLKGVTDFMGMLKNIIT